MCYHRLYIYTTCAHTYSGELVSPCRHLSSTSIFPLSPNPRLFCAQRQHHPYQTLRFHSFCYNCNLDRVSRLHTLLANGEYSPASDTWNRTPTLNSNHGFTELRNERKEGKLMEKWRSESGSEGWDSEAEAVSVKATITAPEADRLSRELQRAVQLHEQRLKSITGVPYYPNI